jgi:hypothetical protein
MDVHGEDAEVLMECIAGGSPECPHYDFHSLVLDRLEFLDEGLLFTCEPEVAPVGEDGEADCIIY